MRCTSLADGRTFTLQARYLIGCDGGRSMVRKAVGACLQGTAVGRGRNREIHAQLLEKVPQTRVAGSSGIHRTIFDTMLRRAQIDIAAL